MEYTEKITEKNYLFMDSQILQKHKICCLLRGNFAKVCK